MYTQLVLLSTKDSSDSGESEFGIRRVVWLGLQYPWSSGLTQIGMDRLFLPMDRLFLPTDRL